MEKRQNFEFTTVGAGAVLQVNPAQFYMDSFLKNKAFENFLLVENQGIKAKVGRFSQTQVLFEGDCDTESTSNALNAKEIEACQMKLWSDLCITDLNTSFYSAWGKVNGGMTPTQEDFNAFVIEWLKAKAAENLGAIAWRGDTGGSGVLSLCDGIETKAIAADDLAAKVVGTTVTASNVIVELGKVYAAIPDALIERDDIVMYMSSNVWRAYLQASAAQSNELYFNRVADPNYLGIKIVVDQNMSANTVFVTRNDNFVQITDYNQSNGGVINMIDMNKTTGQNIFRVTGHFFAGFDYIEGGDVVFYAPTVS